NANKLVISARKRSEDLRLDKREPTFITPPGTYISIFCPNLPGALLL
ncbi:MAG: hypothetical protein ACJAXE_000899, partial [Neolewinella sp.]